MAVDIDKTKSDSAPVAKRSRKRLVVFLGAVLLLFAIVAGLYLNSNTFNNHVRNIVIGAVEKSSGGRVEIQQLQWKLSKLEIDIDGLTIHGKEAVGEVPYAHVDQLRLRLKILSLLRRELGLRELGVVHPVFHIIVYPDGTSNVPTPKTVSKSSGKDPIEQLFSIAMERASVENGLFIWNNRPIVFSGSVGDVNLKLQYVHTEKRYDANLHVGKTDMSVEHLRPFSFRTDISFSVLRDHIEIKSLSAGTGKTGVLASGEVRDLKQPKFAFKYTAYVSVAELGNVLRHHPLRGGRVDLAGSGTFSIAQGFLTSGKLIGKQVEYNADFVHVTNASLTSDYVLDPRRIFFPNLQLNAAGGSMRGELSFVSWLPERLVATPYFMPNPSEHVGSARLEVQGLQAAEVAKAFSTRSLPLSTLNASGIVSGKFDSEWRRSITNFEATMDMNITPPEVASEGQLPLSGPFRGRLAVAKDRIDIQHLSVSSPQSRLTASGSMGSRTGDLQLSLTSNRVAEFLPFVVAMNDGKSLPVNVRGPFTFQGTVRGLLKLPEIAGHVEVRDLTSEIPRSIRQGTPQAGTAQQIHWDSITGDLLYSPKLLSVRNAKVRHADAMIDVTGSVELQRGQLTERSIFDVQGSIRGVDAAEVQSLMGLNYPVTGKIEFAAQVKGTGRNMQGSGNFALRNASAYGQSIHSLTSSVVFKDQEAQFQNVVLKTDVGVATGSAAYNPESKHFRFDAHAKDLRVDHLPHTNHAKFAATGLLSIDASGEGTTEAPVVNAKLRLRNLTINRESVGNFVADAVTHGADLEVKARSDMRQADIILDGKVHLRGDFPGQIALTVNSSNLNPLLAAFVPYTFTGPTVVNAHLQANGPFRSPRAINGRLEIDRLESGLQGIALKNQGPIIIGIAKETARAEQFHIAGEGNRFLDVHGTAQLTGEQRLNLNAGGNINLRLLQTFDPNLLASGNSDFNVVIGGTMVHPLLQGRLNVHDASFAYTDLPNGLSGMNGALVFNENRLEVSKLTAKTGGGVLELGGFIYYDRALSFNLTATGRDIRIRYPEGVSSTGNVNLRAVGSLNSALISGDVMVTRFGLTHQFDIASYLAQSKQSVPVQKLDSRLNNLHVDVHVASVPELQVQTSLAKISGNVDVTLRGTAARPVVLGKVNILEGDMMFNGTKYHLERGDVVFANPVRIEPIVDMEASARVRDYDITLSFHGTPDKLSSNYRSDPPLPTGDIIALLALGRTREESTVANLPGSSSTSSRISETASDELLGQALNATVSSRVQKIFGVSRIKIDPLVGGTENASTARMTVEQQISNKVTLTYITNLTQSAQQVIQMEYNVNRNVSIVAVRDQNGIVGIDVKLRQRKK